MQSPESILKKYFGYDNFRPLQKDIIQNVLDGKDTIALLPTGGGKSLCFQVPALMLEGVCVVVTPLIALMKDQVGNLKQRDIMAVALYSGMSKREIEFELENCINGKYKFLYVSPERLLSQNFLGYAHHINVSMLAIDEAHCISQWGYDFRPPYLKIAEFRNYYKDIPCIALTATATQFVIKDIATKLELKKVQVFTQSFVRKNLAYIVQNEENKIEKIAHIANRIKGTGLIYVRSRKKTVELSKLLNQRNINTDFYHAGLESKERNRKQEDWKKNKIRLMVCTNAFGMGIDKADVRFVIHETKPETLEAYYQEAGRAGRDGKKSYCIFLHHPSDDLRDEENILSKYPNPEDIKRIYELIGNYLKIGLGSGAGENYNFDLNAFCEFYKINSIGAYNAIKILEGEGYLQLSEAFNSPSRIKILCDYQHLYEWQMKYPVIDSIFKVLLRSYGGMFDFYTTIFEREISFRLNKTETWLKGELEKLHKIELIDYVQQSGESKILMLENRFPNIHISLEKIIFLRARYKEKLDAVNAYTSNNKVCRSNFLVKYFDETSNIPCGICDICIEKNKQDLTFQQFKTYKKKIDYLFKSGTLRSKDLSMHLKATEIEEYTLILRWLKDNRFALETKEGYWKWATTKT
ncbi:MAG: RecQ family ATP-dependent DNA helicase [bacterium]|nr:RecQ family ATP-dependent DNA helicase [bacterium]